MTKNKERGVPRKFSLTRLVPNLVTIAAICFGLTSIRYAIDEKWEVSVSLIIIAGILDLLDGRLARLFNASSNFGAYLDSLADFIDFGVAPVVVIYMWQLKNIEAKGLGWAIVLLFAVCMVIRLARFNSELDEEDENDSLKGMFFQGVPAPTGAYLALVPMMLSFKYNIESYAYLPEIVGVVVVIIALSLVSTVPTFSTKKIIIKREHIPFFFVGLTMLITFLITEPWVVLPVCALLYIISMPISYIVHKKLKKS